MKYEKEIKEQYPRQYEEIKNANLELGFTGLDLLAHDYLNALHILGEHKKFEIGSLKQAGGTEIQVAPEGIDNLRKCYELAQTHLPNENYSSLRLLADKMYQELQEVVVPTPKVLENKENPKWVKIRNGLRLKI